MRVADFQDSSCHGVRQIADNGDHDEAGNHGDDVSAIIAARFCEHAGQENAEHRTVSVTINSEHNRNDAHVR